MKQLLYILAILLTTTTCYSQKYGAPNSTTEMLGGNKIDSALVLPWYTPFINKGAATTGRIMVSKTDSLLQYQKAGVIKKVLTKWDSGTVYVDAGEVGQPYGVAGLNSAGQVPSANLPAIVVNGQVYVDTNQAQMLSHSAATAGALSIRTDSSNNLYCLVATPYSVRANWHITQGNGVSAFNSRTGAITPRSLDYKTDSVPEGVVNLYFQTARVQAVNATDTGVSGWLASQAQVKDSAAAVRAAASTATVAIGSTVTGSTNSYLFFAKGSKLGQSSVFTVDTASKLISVYDGVSAGRLAAGSAFYTSISAAIDINTSPPGITLDNLSGGTILLSPPAMGSTSHTNYFRAVTDSFAYLGDIVAKASTWVHLATVPYTSFNTAATTQTINSGYTLPAGWIVEGVVINPATNFSGGTISGYTLSVGGTVSGSTTKYASNINVFTGANFKTINSTFGMESFTSGSRITLTATSTGGNLSTATAGSVDVYLLVSQL